MPTIDLQYQTLFDRAINAPAETLVVRFGTAREAVNYRHRANAWRAKHRKAFLKQLPADSPMRLEGKGPFDDLELRHSAGDTYITIRYRRVEVLSFTYLDGTPVSLDIPPTSPSIITPYQPDDRPVRAEDLFDRPTREGDQL